MSLDKIIKGSIYGDFRKFGIIMLILIPLRAIAGLDLIEIYMDLILIGISLVIVYVFLEINKIKPSNKLLHFSLAIVLANVGYFIADILDKYIFNTMILDVSTFFAGSIIFIVTIGSNIVHIYGWNEFRRYIVTSPKLFPENIEENSISGSKNVIYAIAIRIATSIITLFISNTFGDMVFILGMVKKRKIKKLRDVSFHTLQFARKINA
ncbi:MAG: hypothetical protein P8Y97_11440 [Candidatus Lokiarchaeota archaeon]